MQEETGGRGWLCALGAEHLGTMMAQEEGADAQEEGADEKEKRGADDDGGGGSVFGSPFAIGVDAERGVVVAAVACYFLA